MAMGNLPPFEDREAYGGFFPALFQTWLAACFRPTEFFESVGNSQDLSPALLFGVMVGWIGLILDSLSTLAFRAHLILLTRQGKIASQFATDIGGLLCVSLIGWLFVLLGIIVGGLVTHLFLMILGGANEGLRMTLRVVSYANAPSIFSGVPFIGWCIATIWEAVLCIIGLAVVHRTDNWRAALAVIVPSAFCFCVIGVALSAAVFSGMAHKPVP